MFNSGEHIVSSLGSQFLVKDQNMFIELIKTVTSLLSTNFLYKTGLRNKKAKVSYCTDFMSKGLIIEKAFSKQPISQ